MVRCKTARSHAPPRRRGSGIPRLGTAAVTKHGGLASVAWPRIRAGWALGTLKLTLVTLAFRPAPATYNWYREAKDAGVLEPEDGAAPGA